MSQVKFNRWPTIGRVSVLVPSGSGILLGALVMSGEDLIESVPYGAFCEEDSCEDDFDDFRCGVTELEEDDVISRPCFFNGTEYEKEVERQALQFIARNISPGAGYGRQIFDEIEKYGHVVSQDELCEQFIATMGKEGDFMMDFSQVDSFSSHMIRDGDERICYELANDEDTREFLSEYDDSTYNSFEEQEVSDDSTVNHLSETVENMSKSKKKCYYNKEEVPINIGSRKLIFPVPIPEMIERGSKAIIDSENDMHLKSDLFWHGSNGVVQMDGKLYSLGEPALCMRIKRKEKYYKAFVFSYEIGYSIPRGMFKFSYPFDVGFKMFVRNEEVFKGKKKKDKNSVSSLLFIGHSFKIKEEIMLQMMRFFKRRKFLFGEYILSGDRKLNACLSRTSEGIKRMRLLSLSDSCKNIFFGDNEIYRYSQSLDEEFFIDVFGNLSNARKDKEVCAEVSIRLWFEFDFGK